MSLIICPECKAKISERACICPNCGFQVGSGDKPISASHEYEIIPYLQFDLLEGGNSSLTDYYDISPADNKKLFDFLSNWEFIQNDCIQIALVIKELAHKENVLIANIKPYIKKLIDEGIYRLSIDKNGEILPTIRDAKGIVHQVRLVPSQLSPNILPTVGNLAMAAAMHQLLVNIEECKKAINDLRIEVLTDRYGELDGTWDSLMQARKIQDQKLREFAIINIIQKATGKKKTLERSFTNYYYHALERNNKQKSDYAKEALDSLKYIFGAVRIECAGYMMLDEKNAYSECINEFQSFIRKNKLYTRDNLVRLGETMRGNANTTIDIMSNTISKIIVYKPINLVEGSDNILMLEEE